MSIRYGIDLVLQPSFTAKVYQTRQIVCGQYSAWAAEMQMLRMRLTPFFPCPDDRVPVLESQVDGIAAETRSQQPCVLRRTGIVADTAMNGVVLEFEAPALLLALQGRLLEAARTHSPDVTEGDVTEGEPFRPSIILLEYGSFPEAILSDAVEFAAGVASGLGVPDSATPWRLLLTRYSSEAAGDDWSNGRWAADLSWQQVSSHALYT